MRRLWAAAALIAVLAGLSALHVLALDRITSRMAGQLEQIVSYMDVLSTLDTEGVEPMSHVFPLKNVMRPDLVVPSRDRDSWSRPGRPSSRRTGTGRRLSLGTLIRIGKRMTSIFTSPSGTRTSTPSVPPFTRPSPISPPGRTPGSVPRCAPGWSTSWS